MALQVGPVTLTVLQDPLHSPHGQALPVGDAVTTAMQIQRQARDLGWPVAATVSAVRLVAGAVQMGRRALVRLPGRADPVDLAEITGLAA